MASKNKRSGIPDEELKIDMSPMIDMVFLLLIFFIVNATAIIVQTDPEVRPPIAKNSKRQKDGQGRIVINVRSNGTFSNEQFVVLQDKDAITEVVKAQKLKIDAEGLIPKLHLRGDEEAMFKYSRTAISAAADAGVTQVVFAVYENHKGVAPAVKK